MENQKEKLLRLWKARQEAEGQDVSGVTTLEEAKQFYEKKNAPELPEVQDAPKKRKVSTQKKAKEV